MIVGKHFPSRFTKDNFVSRRTTGLNMYDPECLITGAELAAGFSYTNSAREWNNQSDYDAACMGLMTPDQIVHRAPRVLLSACAASITTSITTNTYHHQEVA
jgi:hypothetical protein